MSEKTTTAPATATTEKPAKEKKAPQSFNVHIAVGDKITAIGSLKAKNAIDAARKIRRLTTIAQKVMGNSVYFQSPDIDYAALESMKLLD